MVEIKETTKQEMQVGKDTLMRVFIESDNEVMIMFKDSEEFDIKFENYESLLYLYRKIQREINSYNGRNRPIPPQNKKGQFIKRKTERENLLEELNRK